MRDPASAAKGRQRGLTVLERQAEADRIQAEKEEARRPRAKAKRSQSASRGADRDRNGGEEAGRRMDTSGIQYCIAILLFCKYCTYCSMCNTGFWRVLHIPCNTAILMHAVGMHYVMSLFDRYVLQPATIGTGEALLAQYMSMLLMEICRFLGRARF